MLVLTRRLGESIVIGDDAAITVQILKINGNQIRIGISAPKDLPVHRQEIYERIIAGVLVEKPRNEAEVAA